MKPQLSAWVHRDGFTQRGAQNDWLSRCRKRNQQLQGLTVDRLEREMNVRKILLPTDFSPASAKAVQRAVTLAKQYNAAITILHVINILTPCCTGSGANLMRQLRAEASEKMSLFSSSLPGVPNVQTLIAEGLPWEEIVSESAKFDLLVMAKDGCRKTWPDFSQNTLQRVIKQAGCPVLTVPHHAAEELSGPTHHDPEAVQHPAAAT